MSRFRHAGIARTGRGPQARLEIRPRARLHPPASDLAHSTCITSQPINSDDHDGFESKRRQHTQSRPSQPPDTGPLTDHSPACPAQPQAQTVQLAPAPVQVQLQLAAPVAAPVQTLQVQAPTLSIAPQQVCTPQAQVAPLCSCSFLTRRAVTSLGGKPVGRRILPVATFLIRRFSSR